jgi:hypothetical protein
VTTQAHIKLAFAGLFDGDEFEVELTDPLNEMTFIRCEQIGKTTMHFQSLIRQLIVSKYIKPIEFYMSDFVYDFDFDGDYIEVAIVGDLIGQVSLSECLLNHTQIEFDLNFNQAYLKALNQSKYLEIDARSTTMDNLDIQFSPKLVIPPGVVAKMLIDVLIQNGLDRLHRIGVIQVHVNGQQADVSRNIEYFETFRKALNSYNSFYFERVLQQIEHIECVAKFNDKQLKKVEKAVCKVIKDYLQVALKMGLGTIQLQNNCTVTQSILRG